jgi:predicted DNA-binding transcriptional regulator AlpA
MQTIQENPSPEEALAFLNEHQLADLLCQSVRTIQKWRVTGYGPPYYKIGRSVRYRRSEMIAWVEERRKAHTSQ